jgi:histidine triad (HIT) family protein
LSNEGDVAGQVVMHFHMHIIPKYGKNEGYVSEVKNKFVNDLDGVYDKIIKQLNK